MALSQTHPRDPVRALLIDDTDELRDLMRIALTRSGIDVVGEAENGREGIEATRALSPGLILLDLAMPVMDGLAALPILRDLAPLAKIIIVSGYAPERTWTPALATCADGYAQKGLPLPRLMAYIWDIVDTPHGGPPAPALPLAS